MLEQLIISIQIILIDIVMAADNAIIIGLIAANYATENRRKIIAWGVAAAFIFRIIFAFGADYMFQFDWLKILGGVLLLWIINNLRQDFFGKNKVRTPQLKSGESQSFRQGVYRVIVADLTISFDLWILSKLSAITAFIPNNLVPLAAQSLEDPVPYSFPAMTTKSFFLFLYSIAAS